MTYQEATDYLYNSAPLFQNIGAGAYKEGLSNTLLLDAHLHHPHRSFRTIHVAGTNGKGSVSHTLAAILQCAGYKVGLYTSPHLIDFRERIRVNGEMIPQERVVRFIEEERFFFEPLHPSFFELATSLAFQYFREESIDIAVVEVGLGGRLDCTNIIQPDLCVITNISFDHIQFLGNTLEKIAGEKAGSIKKNIPVVIGETNGHEGVRDVFQRKANEVQAPIIFAEDNPEICESKCLPTGGYQYKTTKYGQIEGQLGGFCQEKNTSTILTAINLLKQNKWYKITNEQIREGFLSVCDRTGLMGRWQTLQTEPRVICDTGHNVGGMQYITSQLVKTPHNDLHIIIGMVSDKDINTVLSMLPKEAEYYFTQASVKRALPVKDFAEKARTAGLKGQEYADVNIAYSEALKKAQSNDIIFVGGSTFIVADLLKSLF